ncbi:MAG: hypothetical protein JJU02_07980 [Cryomorphaceae bacterium]|nr:hypothetical protein [Cryomorphaceae bacterium]
METDKTLTPQQLRNIFDFCKKWDVQYVDLRLELVDHIAEQITDIRKKEPDQTFQQAFHKVYKSFGIHGLNDVVEEHQTIVRQKYWGEVRRGFVSWLKLPRILGTILSLALIYTLFRQFPQITIPVFLVILIVFVWAGVYFAVKSRRLSKQIHGEKTMLLSTPVQYAWVFYFMYWIPIQTFYISYSSEVSLPVFAQTTTGAMFLAFFVVATLLFISINAKLLEIAGGQVVEMKKRLQVFFC